MKIFHLINLFLLGTWSRDIYWLLFLEESLGFTKTESFSFEGFLSFRIYHWESLIL